jgi:hypothetical protein
MQQPLRLLLLFFLLKQQQQQEIHLAFLLILSVADFRFCRGFGIDFPEFSFIFFVDKKEKARK